MVLLELLDYEDFTTEPRRNYEEFTTEGTEITENSLRGRLFLASLAPWR